ncbi:hypothetical protein HN011_000995 [Eciton burchellii]|nr:hypothetical protein HN011_000995 [Eciton burchellii]
MAFQYRRGDQLLVAGVSLISLKGLATHSSKSPDTVKTGWTNITDAFWQKPARSYGKYRNPCTAASARKFNIWIDVRFPSRPPRSFELASLHCQLRCLARF